MSKKATFIIRGKASKATAAKSVASSSATGEFLHKNMAAYAKELSKDPDAALGFLKRAGIVTRTGKLAKTYGG